MSTRRGWSPQTLRTLPSLPLNRTNGFPFNVLADTVGAGVPGMVTAGPDALLGQEPVLYSAASSHVTSPERLLGVNPLGQIF